MQGWFKVPRTVVLQPFFKNERMVKVWLWMMAKASHKDCTYLVGMTPVDLKPGQFVYGSLVASQELDIPCTSLKRIIRSFEKQGVISVKAGRRFSLITLTEWSFSQFGADHRGTTDGLGTDTNKNDKNVKNDKNTIGDKIQFAPFVFLKQEQHDKLVADYGEEGTQKLVDLLNNHKGATGKTYKDDYYAILSWCVKSLYESDRPYKKTNTFKNYTDEHPDFSDIEKSAVLKRRKRNQESKDSA